jgi:hypothetical protein
MLGVKILEPGDEPRPALLDPGFREDELSGSHQLRIFANRLRERIGRQSSETHEIVEAQPVWGRFDQQLNAVSRVGAGEHGEPGDCLGTIETLWWKSIDDAATRDSLGG